MAAETDQSTTSGLRRTLLALVAGLIGTIALTNVGGGGLAYAVPDICGPGDSGKIDTSGDPLTVTVVAPAGFLIDGYCVKAGSGNQVDGGPEYVTVAPPQASVTFGHSTGKAVSHWSVTYVPISTPTSTTSTTTTSTTTTTTSTVAPTTPTTGPTTTQAPATTQAPGTTGPTATSPATSEPATTTEVTTTTEAPGLVLPDTPSPDPVDRLPPSVVLPATGATELPIAAAALISLLAGALLIKLSRRPTADAAG